jgi:hypothetical protein
MGKSTISMVILNSYVKLPEGNLYKKSKLTPRIPNIIIIISEDGNCSVPNTAGCLFLDKAG